MSSVAPTMQAFFTERLVKQRGASPRTVTSYRDTMRLLLGFVQQRTGKAPATLSWDDLDATVISAFLDHLESDRHNGPRTRNLRLTAIRSLFAFAALRHPEHAAVIQRVLAIPPKRFVKKEVTFLAPAEAQALIDAPDCSRWEGRRDRALLVLALQTGLRVSELTGLNCGDVTVGNGGHVRCEGKGRKQRTVPLTSQAQAVLRVWLAERGGSPQDPLFPTRTGRRLSRDAVETAGAHPRRHRIDTMPVASGQGAPPPRPAAQLRHVLAAGRRRHHRDRPVARPRRHPLHPALPARRSQHQGTGAGFDHPVLVPTRPLPAARHAPRLPGVLVTMPTAASAPRPRSPP
jgi:site-specific recombinase XerD